MSKIEIKDIGSISGHAVLGDGNKTDTSAGNTKAYKTKNSSGIVMNDSSFSGPVEIINDQRTHRTNGIDNHGTINGNVVSGNRSRSNRDQTITYNAPPAPINGGPPTMLIWFLLAVIAILVAYILAK